MKTDIESQLGRNQIGWDALQHKDGWWVGDEDGVICYKDHLLARAALTIAWQRDGGRAVNFRIKPFTGAEVKNGEYTPKRSAAEALETYERLDHFMRVPDASAGGPS